VVDQAGDDQSVKRDQREHCHRHEQRFGARARVRAKSPDGARDQREDQLAPQPRRRPIAAGFEEITGERILGGKQAVDQRAGQAGRWRARHARPPLSCGTPVHSFVNARWV
jgi:hypothetical protein